MRAAESTHIEWLAERARAIAADVEAVPDLPRGVGSIALAVDYLACAVERIRAEMPVEVPAHADE